jgi:hypothetical protein
MISLWIEVISYTLAIGLTYLLAKMSFDDDNEA